MFFTDPDSYVALMLFFIRKTIQNFIHPEKQTAVKFLRIYLTVFVQPQFNKILFFTANQSTA